MTVHCDTIGTYSFPLARTSLSCQCNVKYLALNSSRDLKGCP